MTNQESTTILIKDGLSKATATGVFPTFALKYFVPIYDYRIDTGVHSNIGDTSHPLTNAIPTSASVSSSAVLTPVLPANIEGDILWQNTTEDYRLYETGDIFYAAATETPSSNVLATTMSNAFDRITIVKEGGSDFTPQKSFTKAWKGAGVISQTSTDGSWEATGGWTEVTNSTLTSTTWVKDKLMNEIVYAGRNGASGTYNITIPDSYGSNKINKVLIFIQRVNADGTDYTTTSVPPVPFAMVSMKDPIHIYSTSDTANSNSVNGAQFRVSIDFTASNTEVTYTPGDPFFNLAASPSTSSTQEPVEPITFKGDVLLGPGDGGTAIGSPAAKLDLLRFDGKVLHLGTDDIATDPGHFVEVGTDGIHIYDDATQIAGSQTSVWLSKTKPTGPLVHSIGKFESGAGVNSVNYSLVNAIHDGSAAVSVISNSVAVGENHDISSSLYSVSVGKSLDVAAGITHSSLVGFNNNINQLTNSSVVGSGTTITQACTNSFIAMTAGTNIKDVKSSVIVGDTAALTATTTSIIGSFIATEDALSLSVTATATVSNSLILGKTHDIDYGLTSVQINGQNNKVAIQRAIQYSLVHGNSNNLSLDSSLIFGTSNVAKSTDANSKFAYMFGRENQVESTATPYNSVQNHIHGEGFWVQDSKYVIAMGGDTLNTGTTPLSLTYNNTKILRSDNVTVLGKGNELTYTRDSAIIGNLNEITNANLTQENIENNFLVGISNKISQSLSTVGGTAVKNNNVIGNSNEIKSDSASDAIYFQFSDILGSSNVLNFTGGANTSFGQTMSIEKSGIFGYGNNLEVSKLGKINKFRLVGSDNIVKAKKDGANTKNPYISGAMIGNNNQYVVDADTFGGCNEWNDLNDITIIGSHGTVDGSFAKLQRIYRSYAVYSSTTNNWELPTTNNGYGDASANDPNLQNNMSQGGINLIISNGFDDNNTTASAAMTGVGLTMGGININTTASTGTNNMRQAIILPFSTSTSVNFQNPINPSNTSYAIPTLQNLKNLMAAGKNPPKGTLCYDETTSDNDYHTLLLWAGETNVH